MTSLADGGRGKVVPFPGRPSGDDVSDFELLGAVRAGDNAALRDLFRRHGDRVYRVLRSDCGVGPRWAPRGVRDTFLAIWSSPARFDGRHSVAGVIVRAALRLGALGPSFEPRLAQGARRATEVDQTPEVVTALEATVAALPWGQRMATVLLEREVMTEGEISDALRVPERVVWRWISDARHQLAVAGAVRPPAVGLARVGRSVATARLCPPLWKINRAVSTDLTAQIGAHLSACPSCTRELAILTGVSAWLANLPRREMTDEARDEVAVSLLAAPLAR
jgi:DNA-directed RNA polymerase specialized sigma24 family protein